MSDDHDYAYITDRLDRLEARVQALHDALAIVAGWARPSITTATDLAEMRRLLPVLQRADAP